MDKIHIALAFCDPKGTYCQHAAVTIASVFANTKSPVCVHVLHDETLTDENRAKLEELAENFKQEIDFVNAGQLIEANFSLDCNKLTHMFTRGSLYRLLLPEILDTDKVIYLDCDVIVTLDIAELWKVDMQNQSIAVVPDEPSLNYMTGIAIPKRLDIVWDLFEVQRGEYFNSGVMLMDLSKIRKTYNIMRSAEKFFTTYKSCVFAPDQDFLNFLFTKDKILLDEKFNRIRYEDADAQTIHNSIWHLAGLKPWNGYTRQGIDELYWYYLAQTPYGNSSTKLISAMITAWDRSSWYHRHSSGCIKRLKGQVYDNITKNHIIKTLKMKIVVAILKQKMKGKNKR